MLTEREEKYSVAAASTELFSGWTRTFNDPRPCAAIADRLTFKALYSPGARTSMTVSSCGRALAWSALSAVVVERRGFSFARSGLPLR
jgi:hypothetical protein